jgi:hypothetical protein
MIRTNHAHLFNGRDVWVFLKDNKGLFWDLLKAKDHERMHLSFYRVIWIQYLITYNWKDDKAMKKKDKLDSKSKSLANMLHEAVKDTDTESEDEPLECLKDDLLPRLTHEMLSEIVMMDKMKDAIIKAWYFHTGKTVQDQLDMMRGCYAKVN